MADAKKEYTSNLHPKGDLDTTVYPNVKSENIIDKDTTAYNAGKVPDSSLVQKSLDGLNEKIETNKIQTETNKTNIATLQGDVAGLKTDNQTTKTTIAGLVSSDMQNKANIAKNTQNIENLSAVMPTDINVDANGYAILEHDGTEITGQKKKVKFAQTDKKASFSEVTIPTATALKTKDGSSLGSNVQRIDITTILSQADILSLVVALTGHLENPSFTFDFTFTNNINNPTADEIDLYLDMSAFGETGFIDLFFIKSSKQDGIRYASTYTSYAGKLIRCGGIALTGADNILTTIYGGGIACVDYALKTDLNAKQATLYRHTITIGLFTNASDKHLLVMTHQSENNLKIDSIQDLITVFKGTSLSCVCTHETTIHISDTVDDIYINNVTHSKINVGNTLAEITLNTASDSEEEPFTDVFGTTGFTITDNVTAMQGGYL